MRAVRTPWADRTRSGEERGGHRAATLVARRPVASAVALGLALTAVWIGADDDAYLRVAPGPLVSVSTVLDTDGQVPGDEVTTEPVFATIAATRVTNARAAWCTVSARCRVILAPDTYDQINNPPPQPDPDDPDGAPVAPPTDPDTSRALRAANDAATVYAARDHTAPSAWARAPGSLDGLGAVHGPSAGVAVALYLIDLRTPGDLLGGTRVAATGAIDSTGAITEVGGVADKASAVAASTAEVFFVPAANAEQARAGAGDVPVVPVRDLGEVLAWLCEHHSGRGGPDAVAAPGAESAVAACRIS